MIKHYQVAYIILGWIYNVHLYYMVYPDDNFLVKLECKAYNI